MTPMMIVGPKGTVTSASPSAVELLGPTAGRTCCDLVRARDGSGQPVCTANCALALLRDGARERDTRQAKIRGRSRRLLCTPVGGNLVVSLLPDAPIADASAMLTGREKDVLELVAEGLTTVEIARQLEIRPATVRTHVEHAREKLGARTRAEAVARALELRQLERA